MNYAPHHYQQYATEWMIEKKQAGLFLDMGMGKTVCTLTAIAALLYDYFDIQSVLIIAPIRVAESTWHAEVEKWDHLKGLRVAKVLGPEKERRAALSTPADIYLINRENVSWLVNHYQKNWPFDMVVIDELSSFKSHKAARFKQLRKVRPLMKRIVGLTGTPSPNGLMDLWAQVYLLDGGERLGKTMTGYRERYFHPDKRNQAIIYSWKPKPDAEDAIYEKLSDLCISMKAEDYLELPDKIINRIPVNLDKTTKATYDRLERDLLLPLKESDVVASTAAVLSNKLLQLAGGAVYDEEGDVQVIHDAKLKALEDIIEAANGKPVLIFYAYQHEADRIKAKWKQVRMLETPEDVEGWNRGEIPLLLAHPASTGHGLNLQAGGHLIVWFGLTWSLELYSQANARLYRQGQEHPVFIHHLIAEGTVDEDVMKALENKEVGQEALLQAMKARIERQP